ncbi:DNA-binding transcriptional regulator, LysR family [Nannocystis exedens]|uniref:DNA-binding transcriptional regulator, LysR family n=1 Tax=Nannocystis exedens TaxID=54 RepID=A0A1I2FU84_9BACT|nr:LysR family transcriptional regulator [Nannocystis exedens]PCC73702.1 LysR family transcriptional regulator [Nannocystis exedens]SFF08388.1 DNA-binding transcriptional regulator, LysR family [Nannocystis exedens]
MNSRPDFAAIEAFVRVAETGSFRAAAVALAAPVSTVSVQVSRLEARLGTRLFERTTRRVRLTDEGQRYFEQVRAGLDVVTEAERAVAEARGEARGRLRIAAPSGFAEGVLGRVLGRFTQEHPQVDVEIELTAGQLDPLRDGFDVVIQAEPAASASLVARKIGAPTKYRLVASPEYLARRGTPAHPRELAKHTCLVMGTRREATTWRFAKKGSARSAVVHRHATANSWPLIRDLAVSGCGIARLPEYLAAPAISEGRLVQVLDDFCPAVEQMYAVYARSRHVPARLSSFVAALQGFLAVWPGCLPKPPTAAARARG